MLFGLALIAVLAMPGCDSMTESEFEPGPLGAVTLEQGEAVQIRLLASVTVAPSLGAVSRQGAEFAAEDLGPSMGARWSWAIPLTRAVRWRAARAGALGIVGDPQVAGVVGTNCSAAAVAASPVISDAAWS